MTGAKRFGSKIFKNLRNEENVRSKINIITEEQWIQYYREMLVEEEQERQTTTQHLDEQNEITMEDLEEALRQ
jgi:parvulin-like peptidyl-prolyl isomerase